MKKTILFLTGLIFLVLSCDDGPMPNEANFFELFGESNAYVMSDGVVRRDSHHVLVSEMTRSTVVEDLAHVGEIFSQSISLESAKSAKSLFSSDLSRFRRVNEDETEEDRKRREKGEIGFAFAYSKLGLFVKVAAAHPIWKGEMSESDHRTEPILTELLLGIKKPDGSFTGYSMPPIEFEFEYGEREVGAVEYFYGIPLTAVATTRAEKTEQEIVLNNAQALGLDPTHLQLRKDLYQALVMLNQILDLLSGVDPDATIASTKHVVDLFDVMDENNNTKQQEVSATEFEIEWDGGWFGSLWIHRQTITGSNEVRQMIGDDILGMFEFFENVKEGEIRVIPLQESNTWSGLKLK